MKRLILAVTGCVLLATPALAVPPTPIVKTKVVATTKKDLVLEDGTKVTLEKKATPKGHVWHIVRAADRKPVKDGSAKLADGREVKVAGGLATNGDLIVQGPVKPVEPVKPLTTPPSKVPAVAPKAPPQPVTPTTP